MVSNIVLYLIKKANV